METNPLWGRLPAKTDEDLCFVIMPFDVRWKERVFNTIDWACKDYGLYAELAEDPAQDPIAMTRVWETLGAALVVIADLTGLNPNVIYELGLVDAICGTKVMRIMQSDPNGRLILPFDLRITQVTQYEDSDNGRRELRGRLQQHFERFRYQHKLKLCVLSGQEELQIVPKTKTANLAVEYAIVGDKTPLGRVCVTQDSANPERIKAILALNMKDFPIYEDLRYEIEQKVSNRIELALNESTPEEIRLAWNHKVHRMSAECLFERMVKIAEIVREVHTACPSLQ
jgi:hypothetical protein